MRAGVIKELNIRYILFQRKIGEMSLKKKKKKNTTLNFRTFVKSFEVQFVTFLNEESF